MAFITVHNRIGSDIWANTRLRILTRAIQKLGGTGKTILDLGCGKGYVGSALAGKNKVVFAEIDPELIKHVKGARIILDAVHMPFAHETFDYVICGDVLEHIKNDRQVLRNIYDILKTGGHAIIALPAYSRFYAHHDELVEHYRRYDRKPFEKMAAEMGFTIQSVRYNCSLLFFPWLLNQLMVKSDKAYVGTSRIEKKLIPLLDIISEIEASLSLPYGINLQFILKK